MSNWYQFWDRFDAWGEASGIFEWCVLGIGVVVIASVVFEKVQLVRKAGKTLGFKPIVWPERVVMVLCMLALLTMSFIFLVGFADVVVHGVKGIFEGAVWLR